MTMRCENPKTITNAGTCGDWTSKVPCEACHGCYCEQRDEIKRLSGSFDRMAKALHDVAHPTMDSSDDASLPAGQEPLCLDEECFCRDGFCFCPDDPGCLSLDDDGDGKHFNTCIAARRVLREFIAAHKA